MTSDVSPGHGAAVAARSARWYTSIARKRGGVDSKLDDADGAAEAATKCDVGNLELLKTFTSREAWLGRVHSTAKLAVQYEQLRARAVAAVCAATVSLMHGATKTGEGGDERGRQLGLVRSSQVRLGGTRLFSVSLIHN
jgi:hypothetical protein